MRAALFALSVLLLSSSTVLAQSSTTTPAACEALQKLQLDGVALTVTKTQWFPAGAPLPGGRAGGPPPAATNLPAHCRIDGVIDRRTGVPALSYPGHASLRLRHLDDSDRIEQHGECHEHHKDGPIARPPSAHVIRVRRHADLTIQPDVEGVGLLDWRQLEQVRSAGRQAARAAHGPHGRRVGRSDEPPVRRT